MSHDRGCFCGKEKYEYDGCTDPGCCKKKVPGSPVNVSSDSRFLKKLMNTVLGDDISFERNEKGGLLSVTFRNLTDDQAIAMIDYHLHS